MAEMYKTPELRFPEFEGNWETIRLGEIGEFKNGINKGKSDFGFGHPFVNLMDVFGKSLLDSSIKLALVNANASELINYQLNEGDVLFIRSSVKREGVGETIVVDDTLENTVYSGFLIRFRDNGFISKGFKKYCFWTRKFRNQLISYSSTSANTNINQESLVNLKLSVPRKQEQQKIASFLTAVDERIQLLQQKKAKLEEYKKGVMQKLFSPKGGQAPEIRFKIENEDGELVEPPDWEEKRLGELCNRAQSGGTPKSTNRDYYDGDIPFLSISDMTSQGKYLRNTTKSISQSGLDNSSSWLVPSNSLIYSMYASVGFVSINKIPLATSQAVMNIIPKEGVELEYLYYYLLFFRPKISKYIETGTQGNINAQIVKNLPMPIPSLQEQQKIISFLTSLDEIIETVNNQIAATTTFKKGLLQKMFV